MTNFSVTSRGQALAIDTSKFSEDIKQALFEYGLTQKVSDAASGAMKAVSADGETRTVEQITMDMMQQSVQSLYAGVWSTRSSVDAFAKWQIKAILHIFGLDTKKYEKAIATYKLKSSAKERREYLLAKIDSDEVITTENVTKIAKHFQAAQAEADALAKKLASAVPVLVTDL